jgi:hypothetical protein
MPPARAARAALRLAAALALAAAAAAAPLSPAQAAELTGEWRVDAAASLHISGHVLDAALKAAVAAAPAGGADLAAVFAEAATPYSNAISILHVDPASGLLFGFQTHAAVPNFSWPATLRLLGVAAPGAGGAVALTFTQDDDSGLWTGSAAAGRMELTRLEGEEAVAEDGRVVDNHAAATLAFDKDPAGDVAAAAARVAEALPLRAVTQLQPLFDYEGAGAGAGREGERVTRVGQTERNQCGDEGRELGAARPRRGRRPRRAPAARPAPRAAPRARGAALLGGWRRL